MEKESSFQLPNPNRTLPVCDYKTIIVPELLIVFNAHQLIQNAFTNIAEDTVHTIYRKKLQELFLEAIH